MSFFTIDRYLGWSVRFANGFRVGWNWVHGNGETSKTSACIASYHNPRSLTWRWALYYYPPKTLKRALRLPKICAGYGRWKFRAGNSGSFSGGLVLPLAGTLWLDTQKSMFLDASDNNKSAAASG